MLPEYQELTWVIISIRNRCLMFTWTSLRIYFIILRKPRLVLPYKMLEFGLADIQLRT